VILRLASASRANLTEPGAQRDNFPKWSPAGDWIAFTSDRDDDEQFRIYLVRPGGSRLHRLTDSPGDARATWSPDGNGSCSAVRALDSRTNARFQKLRSPTENCSLSALTALTDNQWEDGTPIWIAGVRR
jgi:Tol biopolymer transport system component